MPSNTIPTVAVIANFDEAGDAQFRAWCFACGEYLSSEKQWATRQPAVNAGAKHLSSKHGTAEPAYSPAAGRPSDVKVGEVA